MHPLFETLSLEFAEALQGLSARDTQCRPRHQQHKWSVQQIVEHLLLTYRSTVPLLEARIQKGRPTLAVPTLRQRLSQTIIIGLGIFPAGQEAPRPVSPGGPAQVQSGAELLARVTSELSQLDALLSSGERIFGSKRAATHFALGPLSLHGWRRFHVTHARHHLRQIRSICKAHQLGA